jgi:hypothetical protein
VVQAAEAVTDTVKGRAPAITAPTVTYVDVNTNGAIDTGDTLTAVDGTFSDADTDIKTASSYRWSDGTADRGNAASYTLVAADLAKTITLYTKARTDSTITDPAEGVEVTGPGTVVVTGRAPTATSVGITGNANVREQLAGAYTYADPDSDPEGTSTFRWLRADTAGGTYTAISGATARTYTLVAADLSKFLKYEVTPKSSIGTPSTGVAVQSGASLQVQVARTTATADTTARVLIAGPASGVINPLLAADGRPPYVYEISSGTLPAGLALSASTGAVSGTPTTVRTPVVVSPVMFRVKDANNVYATTNSAVDFSVNGFGDPAGGSSVNVLSSTNGSTATVSVSNMNNGCGQLGLLQLIAPDGTVYQLASGYIFLNCNGPRTWSGSVDLSSKPLNGTWRVNIVNNSSSAYVTNWRVTF